MKRTGVLNLVAASILAVSLFAQQGIAQTGGTGNAETAPLAPVAPATATAVKSWLFGLQYNSTQPTFTNGQQGSVQGSARGALIVAPGIEGFAVTGTLGAGSAVIGKVGIDTAMAGITPVVSGGAANSLVAKNSPGTSWGAYATNFNTSTSGFLIGYNATAVPSTGALTAALVLDCIPLSAAGIGGTNDQPGPPTTYSVGIVWLITSASTCYTYTTGTITAFIKAKVN